jgi:hypothetical protein
MLWPVALCETVETLEHIQRSNYEVWDMVHVLIIILLCRHSADVLFASCYLV